MRSKFSNNILIVIPDKENREKVKQLIDGRNYIIFETETGQETLELIKEQDIQLVITDTVLPDTTGITLITSLKQRLNQTPIIVLTSEADLETTLEAIRLGVFDFLLYPYEDKILLRVIKRALTVYHSRQARKQYLQALEIMNKELIKMERAKKEYLSLLAHDLKNPLTGVSGSIESLLNGYLGKMTGEQKDLLEVCTRSCHFLLRLIEDTLDLSKFEAGRIRLYQEPLSINEVINRGIQGLKSLANLRQIHLKTTFSEDLQSAWIDGNFIERVIINLLSNTLKFTPSQGNIHINVQVVSENPNFICVSIKDTGPGIPENELEKIFHQFYRIEDEKTRKLIGTGLGLSFCREVIELHRGEIWVESKLGQGSTFYFTIPIYNKQKHMRPKFTIE